MYEFVDCNRCGATFLINRKRKKLRMFCESCRVQKANTIQSGDTKCLPWHGRFDADMVTPIDDHGNPIMQGERNCGNLDCVAPSHLKG